MPRVGLNHERVLETATELINGEGLGKLALGQLAKKLNVKPPSLYNHVANLETLKRDLALLAIKTLSPKLQKATVGKAGNEALSALAHAYREFAKQSPGLFEASLQTVEDKDEELKAAGYEVLETMLAVFAGFGLGGDDALHAIRAFRASLTGFIMLELRGGFGMELNVETSFENLIELHQTALA